MYILITKFPKQKVLKTIHKQILTFEIGLSLVYVKCLGSVVGIFLIAGNPDNIPCDVIVIFTVVNLPRDVERVESDVIETHRGDFRKFFTYGEFFVVL